MRLDLAEAEALRRALNDPLFQSGLKKFFSKQENYYTEQSRNHLNVIPKDFHEKIRMEALAKQYAAMAKAYGTAGAELEKMVNGWCPMHSREKVSPEPTRQGEANV
jgi:hypothetical protein